MSNNFIEPKCKHGVSWNCCSECLEQKEEWARLFHETYERLAPSFGYETREDTKQFDPNSKNGKLMIAVCNEIIALAEERGRRDGEAEGAKRMTAKVRGVFMLYPQEVHDELSIVLKDYLDELSTLTQKS